MRVLYLYQATDVPKKWWAELRLLPTYGYLYDSPVLSLAEVLEHVKQFRVKCDKIILYTWSGAKPEFDSLEQLQRWLEEGKLLTPA
jgi:hypothetical protein